MNAELLFESDPWSEAKRLAEAGEFGRIASIGISEICDGGDVEGAEERWLARLNELLGEPESTDAVRCSKAVSILLRYREPAVVRLFLDGSEGVPVYTFEIVGTDRLVVYKPDLGALSITNADGGVSRVLRHEYADNLRRGGV